MPDKPKTKLELAQEAQVEVQSTINTKRVDFLKTLQEYDSIGGVDQTKESLLEIVKAFPSGIAFPFVQSIFLEAALAKAKKELIAEKKIKVSGKKGNLALAPYGAETNENEQD